MTDEKLYKLSTKIVEAQNEYARYVKMMQECCDHDEVHYYLEARGSYGGPEAVLIKKCCECREEWVRPECSFSEEALKILWESK